MQRNRSCRKTCAKFSLNNCYRCGKQNHKSAQCSFSTARCHNCGKVGHIRKVCRQPKRPPTSQGRQTQRHPVRTVQEGIEDPNELPYDLHTLRAQTGQPLEVDLMLDRKSLCMEDDTGAAMSLVSEKTYRSLFPECCLQLSKACLRTYSGESIKVIGQVEVEVCYEEQRVKLPLLVVKGEGPSLFGQDWLTKIRLDWRASDQCSEMQNINQCVGELQLSVRARPWNIAGLRGQDSC